MRRCSGGPLWVACRCEDSFGQYEREGFPAALLDSLFLRAQSAVRPRTRNSLHCVLGALSRVCDLGPAAIRLALRAPFSVVPRRANRRSWSSELSVDESPVSTLDADATRAIPAFVL